MDHMMALRSSFPSDTTSEFHTYNVDFFTNQSSAFPTVSYGQQSSVNSHNGNPPVYSLSADLQHGHGIAQTFQTGMSSEGQMTSSFMGQSHSQPPSDHFYAFQTPPLYQQKHQPVTNQLMQNPASPCHSQTFSVSMHQNQNSQFSSMPGHPQSPQVSPRHLAQHHSPQILAYNQKSQQIQSSQSQQHQSSLLANATSQPQRPDSSTKQTVSNQLNNSKDRAYDVQFYSNQISQRNDASVNNMHKTQASINKFHHTAQHSAHAPQFFSGGGSNSENRMNGESQFRNNIHASQYGNSMKSQSGNLNKSNMYVSQSSFEHVNTPVASTSLQQSRYESMSSKSQRNQKATPVKSGGSYMPDVAKNKQYGTNFNVLPGYSSSSPSIPKATPTKPSPDALNEGFLYAQNIHYKPKNSHDAALDTEKVVLRNTGTRSTRPAVGNSEYLESPFSDTFYSNSYALPSLAALVESTQESSRQSKVSDSTGVRSNRSSGQVPASLKNTSDNVSPVYWFKNTDSSLASSFQSDIEAMQADVASYVTSNRMPRTPMRASPVSQKASVPRATESLVSGQSGLNHAPQVSEMKKTSNVSRPGEQPNAVSSPVSVRSAKADALAAIQIKQELVDSISRYKSANSSGTVASTPPALAAMQASSTKTGIPESMKTVTVLSNKSSSHLRDRAEDIQPQPPLDVYVRRHSSSEVRLSSEVNKIRQHINLSPNSFVHNMQRHGITSESAADVMVAKPHHQNAANQNIDDTQQVFIQTRRNTISSLLNKSSGSTSTFPPDQIPDVARYKSPVETQRMDIHNYPGQNSLNHLAEQVHNIDVQCTNIQQSSENSVSKNKQGNGTHAVDRIGHGLPKSSEEACIEQPPLNVPLSTNKPEKMTPSKQATVKMEKPDDFSKSASTICYVMLHDYRLICFKSNLETLLLLCQFQMKCFPDKSLQNVNICIDQTLQIKRNVLKHQDSDKVAMVLKKNGFHLGSVLQTISLHDARRVYHCLYGIVHCTHSTCVVEIFHEEEDLQTAVSSLCQSSVGKDLKKEITSKDNCERLVPVMSSEAPHVIARKEKATINQSNKQQSASKPLSSTCLSVSGADTLRSDQRDISEKEVDSDDSDDLILVDAIEDPHTIRWSGTAPKVGGICNTIIGQLRSYVHDSERYLVVDDLCRVFGTTDFYDGVEKENIVLYSCCQEIARFLNAMHSSFLPLQSIHQSLVKEKDIGIHIIDSNYTLNVNSLEKDAMGSHAVKRLMFKQEIVDDDCSSPKQLKLADSERIVESGKDLSLLEQTIHSSQGQKEDSTRGTDLGDLYPQVTHPSEQEHSNKSPSEMKETSRVIPYCDNDTSNSHTDIDLSVTKKSSSPAVQCTNKEIVVDSLSPVAGIHVASAQDVHNNGVCHSERTISRRLSTQSFKGNTAGHSVSHNIEPVVCDAEQQPKRGTDASGILTDFSDALAKVSNISMNQPCQSPSPGFSRPTASVVELSSPVIVDEDDTTAIPLADNSDHEDDGTAKLLANNSSHELVPLESNSLVQEIAPENISNTPSLCSSVENLHESTNQTDNNKDKEGSNKNDHSEASANKQAEDVNLCSLTSCSFEDLIISNPTSSILKKRVEKLKSILETRKNKNLPLPRLTVDSRLNLHLVTNNGSCTEDQSAFSGTSGTYQGVEKDPTQTTLTESYSVVAEQSGTSNNSSIKPVCDPGCSSDEVSLLLRERSRQLSLDNVDASFIKYLSNSRRPLDDMDLVNFRNTDPLDLQPSKCWKAYAKLLQEHRALLDLFSELQKNFANMKEEKKKCERLTKYYKGIIHNVTSTYKNGDQNTPVVIDDDSTLGIVGQQTFT